MTELFVSDCHLSAARAPIIERFVGFLQERARRAERLFILGDLFDYWVGDDTQTREFDVVVEALAALNESTPVHFIAGNRDFLIGERFARRTGCRLLPEAHVLKTPSGAADAAVDDAASGATLLMHGDLLCTDDTAYQRYRRVIRHPLTLATIRRLRPAWRRRLAAALRRRSHDAIARKPAAIMDVNDATVAAYMRRYAVRRLIHGHTHRPAIHDFVLDGKPAQRIVLGDWYERGSVLELSRGRPLLLTL